MESTTKVAPLEDLMVAMDVVDTLRHRQQLVDRELDSDVRREQLIEKLREIYRAQGIEVSDKVLADGVKALEEDRFKYTPPAKSISTFFASIYVKRDRWLKPFLVCLALLLAFWVFYYLTVTRPEKAAQNALPDQLSHYYGKVIKVAEDKTVLSLAQEIQFNGRSALENKNYDDARAAVEELKTMRAKLKSSYKLRIVQRFGERSGVWRIPDTNTGTRNYYLIIEAMDSRGNILSLPIISEESGETKIVEKWGLRVESSTFERIAADKQDDGILQNRDVGQKLRGKLHPEYRISTTGAAITDW